MAPTSLPADRPPRRARALTGGAALLAGALLATSCADDSAPPAADPEVSETGDGRDPASPRTGVALTPRSFDHDDFLAFFDLATDAGVVLFHAGDWAALDEPSHPFEVTVVLGREHGLVPAVVLSASSAGSLFRPLTEDEIEQRVRALTSFAGEHRPDYLGIGNEVNMLATDDPAGFDDWLDAWPRAVAAVREVAPDAVIFPVLQYEWLLGLRAGHFGRAHTPDDAQWELLDAFPGADAIAFTTFPGLVHDDPDDLPDDYYRQIAEHTDRPVLFTEVGWPSDPDLAVHPGSEDEQARFVDRFFALTADLGPELAIWPFVYSVQVQQPPFTSLGLLRADGSAKPAWDRWVEARGAP